MKSLFIGLLALGFQQLSHAAVPTFKNVTEGDLDNIVKELSADFNYTTVTPASTLGKIWGLEFGVVAGYTKTPQILALVKSVDSATALTEKFPHAALIGRVGLPYAFTLESAFIPAKTISDVTFQTLGGAVMWTPTEMFMEDLPFTVAAKGYYTRTKISYTQNLTDTSSGVTSNVSSTIEFKDRIWGMQAIISKKILVFEPFAGAGFVSSNGELSVNASGNATIFANGFSGVVTGGASKSASSKPTSTQLFAGLDIKLLFLSLGAEAQRSFGTSSYTGRVSFRF